MSQIRQVIRTVGVVGFGSAGAAVAIELSRLGFEVEILERAQKIGPVGAGILLHPSGQLVLEKLGALAPLVACSEQIQKIDVKTSRGKQILDIRYDERVSERVAYGVERSKLFRILEQRSLEVGVKLTLGAEVVDVKPDSSGVSCLISQCSPGGSSGSAAPSERRYDLLLLCDGARSKLRSKVVSWQRTWSYACGARWAIGECSAVSGRLHQIVSGTKHLIGVLPTGEGRASFFWGTSPSERREEFSSWREQVLKLCPEAEEILQPLSSHEQLIRADYFHLFSGRPTSERVMLLGDAWHAMSPHLGQGTNLALLDGYLFAQSLAKYQGELSPAQAEFLRRRAGNLQVYRLMSFLFSPFFQSGGLLKGGLRDLALPLMQKIPFIRSQMVVSISGLKRDFLSLEDLLLD